MLNIPDEVKGLFGLDSCRKNFRVHFPNGEMDDLTNENLVEESVELSESICSQSTFKFGLSESSTLEFETVGVGNMLGMRITCGIEVDLSSLTASQIDDIAEGTWDGEYVSAEDSDIGYAYFRVPYGDFIVRSCPRDHQAMTHRRVTAYTDTRDLVTPYQKKLMAAKSFESTYTPSFTMMMYSVFAWNNEQVLLDAGFTRTVIGNFENASGLVYFHTTGAFDCEDGSDHSQIYLRLREQSKNFRIGFGGYANYPADKLYGVDGVEKIDNKGLFSAVAQKLVSDYGVVEAQAYNPANYYYYWDARENPQFARLDRPKIVCFDTASESTSHDLDFLNDPLDLSNNSGFLCINPDRKTVDTNISVIASVSVELFDSAPTSQSQPFATFSFSASDLDLASVYQYTMPQALEDSDFKLNLTPTATIKEWASQHGGIYTLNTFSNSLDISQTLSDYLETNAEFAAPARTGGYRMFSLSDDTDITLQPGQYSHFWWDEYDVVPIGKIKYSISDEGKDNEAVYDFAEYESVYDMTGNQVLKDGKKTKAKIEALLNTSFIPKLGAVQFTPMEITIGNGLPFLEAGDRIEAVSEDGEIAQSYVLEQRISGIQHLIQEIESSGGDLIDAKSVEGV